MSWDFQWGLGTLDLADVANGVVLENEGGSSYADGGVQIPGRDGVQLDPQAPYAPLDLPLRILLRYTNAAGAITHADGSPGHAYENLSLIQAELASRELVALTRTLPHIGAVRAMVKLLAPPIPSVSRIAYRFLLTAPSGSWQDAAESSAAAGSVTTSGDRVIHDPIIEMGAGTLTHTAADGTVSTITATATVVIDVGAGTVTSAGSPARGAVSFSQPWWLRMDPDGAQSFTGTATIKWRNRWA